ncbi:hypothetical protein XELAEV_18045468mg [Xenopus laevis]|uniref:Uncharacterized protein n=1 Tax=Xenopus laevis TaxID=8355 RepID=A0A974C1J4_XENLA|nr:hypothetical protein XELAEV_18045468mg [Xenopus laevis]
MQYGGSLQRVSCMFGSIASQTVPWSRSYSVLDWASWRSWCQIDVDLVNDLDVLLLYDGIRADGNCPWLGLTGTSYCGRPNTWSHLSSLGPSGAAKTQSRGSVMFILLLSLGNDDQLFSATVLNL